MIEAPLFDDLAEAPSGGKAYWATTKDGVQVRTALWSEGARGTILVFPGRTEFIEKYGRVASEFSARGFAVAVVDWRGQGLSERLSNKEKLGHVESFADFQHDVQAMMEICQAAGMPEPYYLCAHSMGGTIAFRALLNGLPVKRTVLSAPLWGILMDTRVRAITHVVAAGVKSVGMGAEFSPGTGPENYIQNHGFEGNVLTSDEGTFVYLVRQIAAHPELTIGGPSINWLHQALSETKALMKIAAPDHKVLCLLGSDEQVVETTAIKNKMAVWSNGQLEVFEGARHEILMEKPDIQARAFEMIDDFYRD